LEVYSKSNEWDYEKEFRLSILYPDGLTDEKRKRKVTDNYFAEVIIGLNTSESDISEILAIAKKKKIKAYKIQKVPFKFELERVEIIL
jgi:hypothetical protein